MRPQPLHHLFASTSLRTLALAAALTVGHAPGLSAQQAGSSDAAAEAGTTPATDDAVQLSPIMVEGKGGADAYTATVFTGGEIEDLGLDTVEQVLRMTPGVNINSAGGTNLSTIYIRGVGSMYPMNLGDSAVPMIMDGAPAGPSYLSLGTLDVQSVEILKGPQGTTFGPSALAGAIDITTRLPTRTLEGYGRAEYGQQGQALLEAAVGGPLTDTLSGRLAVRYTQSDHWVENSADGGEPLSTPSDVAFRGQLLWDAGTGTSARLVVEHETVSALPTLFVLMPYQNPASVDLTPGLYDDDSKTFDRYVLQIDHDLDIGRISSISSYMNTSGSAILAYDGNITTAQYGAPSEYWVKDEMQQSVFTQEVKLSAPTDATLDWVTGAFFQHAVASYDSPLTIYGANSPTLRDYTTDTYALYGDVTYGLTDSLKLTLGLRQNWTVASYDGTFWNSGFALYDSRSMDETATTGRAVLTYAVARTTELHAKYARGYAPGGFNVYTAQVADGEPFAGAINDMIELGFSTATEDGRFALTGAAYVNWVSDNHLLSYDSMTYVASAVNVDTRSQGFELQGRWRPGHGFELAVGVSYVDATITGDVYGVADGDILSGNAVPDVSPWSALVMASYETPLPAFLGLTSPVLKSVVSYNYVGSRPANPQNNLYLDSYQKLDVHLGVAQGQTEVYVRADNLLNDTYDLYGYYVPSASIAYGGMARGRTFVAGITHRF
ncbi:TonB-dependent receptor [Ancylobacter sp. SL191]|uniref:TonB-dependent receptor n=1 Tax=Ancylobacter sp. SL191 TaxID=2995166 RepID=UPI00227194DC|nr:TonB-dependent receptor [Ancylobacter sp. SL191]WAC26638.1 TonB-dependent receptor [Ancylobacter sp. SL191]